MVFMIVLGAAAYNTFLALSQLPQELAGWVGSMGLSPYAVLWAILVFYLIFGCVMDSLSMILLTIPIFFPMVSGLDFGLTPEETAIWFGILVLIVVEVGLITPPVGMNLFVIQSMAPDISIRDTYRGVWPFVASDLLRVTLLVLVPGITLFVLRLWLLRLRARLEHAPHRPLRGLGHRPGLHEPEPCLRRAAAARSKPSGCCITRSIWA